MAHERTVTVARMQPVHNKDMLNKWGVIIPNTALWFDQPNLTVYLNINALYSPTATTFDDRQTVCLSRQSEPYENERQVAIDEAASLILQDYIHQYENRILAGVEPFATTMRDRDVAKEGVKQLLTALLFPGE